MNEAPRKTTVTLEELLRVKRAEQPPPEFWTEFERGLRTKQLAAIVEPRPWWAPFIRLGSRLARYQLPVGATAILAVTLITLREYHPANANPVFEPAAQDTATYSAPAPVQAKADPVAPESAPSAPLAAVAEPAPVTPAATAVETHPQPAVPATAVAAAPAVGSTSHVAMVAPEFSSARYMADNLAAAKASDRDPELDQMLGSALPNLDGNAASPARSEPLAQISVPGESRRSRLLEGTVWAASASTGDSTLRMNDQAARNLTERRLSESDVISRLDVGGNHVTVRF